MSISDTSLSPSTPAVFADNWCICAGDLVKVTHSIWLALARGLGVFLLPCSVFALDPAKSVHHLNCQNWLRENGLPANGINAITQTKDGYLWLGTQLGLFRFDGLEFTQVPLPNEPQFQNQVVSTLSNSKKAGLWFGIRDGPVAGYSESGGFASLEGQPWVDRWMNVTCVGEMNDGSVWVGSAKGTTRWVPGNTNLTQSYKQLPHALVLHQDFHGRIWVGTAEQGLYYWHNGVLNPFADPSLAQESISALAVDSLDQIWVGTKVGLRARMPCITFSS